MATLRPRWPTPTHRTRTSSAWPRIASGWAPSVKTWISAHVGKDVDLGPRVLPDEGAGGADGLAEPVGHVARARAPDRRQRLLPVVAEGRQDARLDAPLDDHDLGARAQPVDEVEGLALGAGKARGRDIRRPHRGPGGEDAGRAR